MDKEWKEETCTCIMCQIGMKWTDDPEKDGKLDTY
jgi:hypothetical protein